ncbi:ROK family protein [Enterococcus faecalis]|nr:ROK family protein [Enterococcus faecalis]
MAEFYHGVGKGKENLVSIVLGTGIGGSIIVDKKVIQTKNCFSGEFGYIFIDEENEKTWEDLDGSVVSIVNRIYKTDARYKEYSGQELFDQYKRDAVLTPILQKFYKRVAIGCYNIQAILDPDLIIIGGAISSRTDIIPNIMEQMNGLMEKRALPKLPNVIAATHKNDANLLGAYLNFINV